MKIQARTISLNTVRFLRFLSITVPGDEKQVKETENVARTIIINCTILSIIYFILTSISVRLIAMHVL